MTDRDHLLSLLGNHVGSPPPEALVRDVHAYGHRCADAARTEANILAEGEVLDPRDHAARMQGEREAALHELSNHRLALAEAHAQYLAMRERIRTLEHGAAAAPAEGLPVRERQRRRLERDPDELLSAKASPFFAAGDPVPQPDPQPDQWPVPVEGLQPSGQHPAPYAGKVRPPVVELPAGGDG